MAGDPHERRHGGDATTGGGASTDRGGRDAGTPGPDPDAEASRPGTGGSPRPAADHRDDRVDDTPRAGNGRGPR